MLTCKEVSRSIASDELATAGYRRRLWIRLHLVMCRSCRRYARQIREIGVTARRIFAAEALEPGRRERLRDSILSQVPSAEKHGTDTHDRYPL